MKKLSLVLTFLMFSIVTMMAQRNVQGSVTDATGDPLIGASVLVKGTSTGAITDIDGKFSVEVPDGSNTLVISYTGYQTLEADVTGTSTIDLILTEGVTLNTAVVTALGITREKKSLGYSSQEVESDQLQNARDGNVVDALSGKVAGLNVISSSGNVGASSQIQLRGIRTIDGSSAPLFIVNGVPYSSAGQNGNGQYGGVDYGNPLNDLNPDDIESINVLKGPNGAALYGSRGMNGVVIITTKSGKNAKKGLGVSYSGSVGFSNPLRLPDYQNQFGQGINYQFQYVDGNGGGLYDGVDESWGPAFDASLSANDGIDNNGDGVIDESGEGERISQFSDPGNPTPWVARPDNIKNAFDTGVNFTNNVAISASGDNVYGRFSYTNQNQKGMVPNTDLKKNILSASFGFTPNSIVEVDGQLTYTGTKSDNRPGVGYDGDNIMQQTIWAGRQVDWQDLRDNYTQVVQTPRGPRAYNWNHNYQNNPYFTLYNNLKPSDRDRINGYARVKVNLTDWLNVTGRIGKDFYNENRKQIFAAMSADFPMGSFNETNLFFDEVNMEAMLNMNKEITDKFSIGANVGVNRMNQQFRSSSVNVAELVVPGIYNVSNANGNPSNSQTYRQKRINSVFGLLTLEYDDWLFLDVTGRNDWSSTLPAESNSYFYPSANLSVVLSEAISMPSFVDFLKIRGGWAQVGNDTRAYRLTDVFSSLDPWNGSPMFAVPNAKNNPNLRPETTTSIEAGIDLRMFNNRVRLDATYYDSKTEDQIIEVTSSTATGFGSRVINAGTLANKGIELMVGFTPVKTSNFSWDIDVNWAKNTSEVMDLPEGTEAIVLGDFWGLKLEAREGEPFGNFRGLTPVYNEDGDIVLSGGLPSVAPGEVNLGNVLPDWTAGVRNTFSYKNLGLSVLIDGNKGGDLFSMTYMFGRYAGVLDETLEGRGTVDEIVNGYAYDGVIDNGDGTYSPNDVAVQAETWNVYYWQGLSGHKRSIFDASYIKLREVTLSYNFRGKFLENTPFESLNIGFFGRNLALLHSNVPHIDPETAFNDNPATRGFEFGQLPTARTFGVRLNANF